MSRWLLILQLPLLVLCPIVVGLGVFGADMDRPTGLLYLSAFVSIPLVCRLVSRARSVGRDMSRLFAICGALAAFYIYGSLHFGWWDEESLVQAFALAALVVAATVCAQSAATSLRDADLTNHRGRAAALVMMAVAWGVTRWFAMFPIFAAGVLLLLTTSRVGPENAESEEPLFEEWPRLSPPFSLRYAMMLFCLDLFLPVWDYGTLLLWGPRVALGLVCAGAITALVPKTSQWITRSALMLSLANYFVCIAYPAWILCPLQSVLAGTGVGTTLAMIHSQKDTDATRARIVPVDSLLLLAGVALGAITYTTVYFQMWRLALFAPLMLLGRVDQTPRPRASRMPLC